MLGPGDFHMFSSTFEESELLHIGHPNFTKLPIP